MLFSVIPTTPFLSQADAKLGRFITILDDLLQECKDLWPVDEAGYITMETKSIVRMNQFIMSHGAKIFDQNMSTLDFAR